VGGVFILAVVSALDAGLLAAAVVLLGRPRPAQKLLAYLVGGMSCSVLFGLLIVFALHGAKLFPKPDPSTSGVIELAAGCLLIAIAIAVRVRLVSRWRARRRARTRDDRPQRQSRYERALGHDALWVAWAAGAVYSLPGVYYLAGLALLARLDEPVTTNVLAILGFNVIMFALIELPLVGFLLAPARTRSIAEGLNSWTMRHGRNLIAILAAAAGIYLLVAGLSDVL
jgi:hypothetical protein